MMPEFLSTYKIKHITVSFSESRNLWFFQSKSGINCIDSAEQSAFNEATCLSLFLTDVFWVCFFSWIKLTISLLWFSSFKPLEVY